VFLWLHQTSGAEVRPSWVRVDFFFAGLGTRQASCLTDCNANREAVVNELFQCRA